MALKKSDLYSSLWKSCDELRGGMDASPVQGLHPDAAVREVRLGQGQGRPEQPDRRPERRLVRRHGRRSRATRRSATGSTRSSPSSPRPTTCRTSSTWPTSTTRRSSARARRCRTGSPSWSRSSRTSTSAARRAEGDDLLGDAYEYLMRHFATESGKSKGQFYTPAEVSRILAKVVGIGRDTRQDQTVYDPTCGSGSLLLKVADEAPRGMTIYGQEKDNATWALSKMNMILHGNEIAEIRKGDTITSPQFTNGRPAARPSTSSSRIRRSRSSPGATAWRTSTAASSTARRRTRTATTPSCCTCSSRSRAPARPPSSCRTACCSAATPRRRSARQLLKRGYIKGIIGLPANLFYGTGIPACIVVLDKENAAGAHRRLHDRRLQGLHEGRPQEPAPQPGHPQDRRRLQQADRDRPLLAHGAAEPRSPSRRTTTTSTSRATSTRPSPRTSRTSTPTCTAASRTATSTRSAATGTPSRASIGSCSSPTGPATAISPSTSPTSSRPSSTRPSSRQFADERRATRSPTGSPPTAQPLQSITRDTQPERPHRRRSATTCSPASSRCRCSTSTTSTSSS